MFAKSLIEKLILHIFEDEINVKIHFEIIHFIPKMSSYNTELKKRFKLGLKTIPVVHIYFWVL